MIPFEFHMVSFEYKQIADFQKLNKQLNFHLCRAENVSMGFYIDFQLCGAKNVSIGCYIHATNELISSVQFEVRLGQRRLCFL